MKNVKMVVDKDNILTIQVDLNENYGASKSGKSTVRKCLIINWTNQIGFRHIV